MKRYEPPILILAFALFLSPIIGGYIDVSSTPATPGFLDLGGYSACTLAHGLIYLLISLAVTLAVARKQVAQLPHVGIVGALGAFLALLAFSVGVSAYHMQSLTTFCDFAMYAVAFLAACGIVGRQEGPKLLCAAFVAGCALTAVGGMFDYVTQIDPTWRIMYHWQDPNALAGMLMLGLFVAIGLGFGGSRITAIFCLFAGGLIGASLLLTQSKGGLAGTMLGGLVFFVLLGAYVRTRMAIKLLYFLAPFALSVCFFAWLVKIEKSVPATTTSPPVASQSPAAPPPSADPTSQPEPLGRVLNPMSTAEQSADFRFNLWKGCWALMKQNVLGYGIGTYRFESAKPGNTTETKLAHNSFLQLAVEAGPLALLALIVFLLLCAYEMLKGSRRLPEKQNMLRAALFAGIFGAVVHNCVDCDLYFTGTGLATFMLLGIGLALSADAIVPELLRAPARWMLISAASVCTLISLYAGLLQVKIETYLNDLSRRSHDVSAEADALTSLCPMDWRVWYYATAASTSSSEALIRAQRSVDVGPTTIGYHRLALVHLQDGQSQEALSALNESLATLDPNNLDALNLKLNIQKQTSPAEAVKTAERLVAIEGTPYFATRAIPEVIPLQTYQARLYLAGQTSDPKQVIDLLRPAIAGYETYSASTVPMIVKFAQVGSNQIGTPKEAVNELSQAVNGARSLAAAYRSEKDENDAKWADAAIDVFTKAMGVLDATLSLSR